MKRVMFVDDQPQVLRALDRMLKDMSIEWDMTFADSGVEALNRIRCEPVDVLVTDMRMPGMDGAVLLEEVSRVCPSAVRIVLSGEADELAVLRAVRPMHQYLSKPCDACTLRAKVDRACALRERLTDCRLTSVVAGISRLPSVPKIYHALLQELSVPEPSMTRITEHIGSDPAMTAKILQLVNSAAFGRPHAVATIPDAVCLLGTETIRTLALTVRAFDDLPVSVPGFSIDGLMHHSLQVAHCARKIAQCQGASRCFADATFTAGMLHDIGKLILAGEMPSECEAVFREGRDNSTCCWEAERRVIGVSHAEVGAYLLGLWELPEPIVEAVAFHHDPDPCQPAQWSPLLCIHVANSFVHAASPAPARRDEVNTEYLQAAGCLDRLKTWQAVCKPSLEAA